MNQQQELLDRIRAGIIGRDASVQTPFGRRPLVYADYTASGRALTFIEDTLREQVLPWYANTHSESTYTGARTGALREQARSTIHAALNGGDDDRIIFCGSGATAAINRLIDILGLRVPSEYARRFGAGPELKSRERPVVFIGPYEHHSNELPWRETRCEVVTIPLGNDGNIDCDALDEALAQYAERPLKIGSFSAASNVTGVRSDITGITAQLRRAGALAFWDFAAAAPYVKIDMNVPGAALDAAFISTHKFVGGPGTPGILAVKSALLRNDVPAVVGGGTVSFVAPRRHRYLDDATRREEGGTPAIVESIRAGLAFQLQQAVGTDNIEKLERSLVHRAMDRLDALPGVEVLGPPDRDRLSILSLRFTHAGRELHYGFVTALLNDLFGIQVRGGCSCAGPYGHALLGLSERHSRGLEAQVDAGFSALRPGWVRLNLNYFIDEEEFDFLLTAIELVATHGWKLLPSYRLEARSGVWRHRDAEDMPVLLDLFSEPRRPQGPRPLLSSTLDAARVILEAGSSEGHRRAANDEELLPEAAEALRWFVLPRELWPKAA